jgi:hypothetical protein
MKLRSKLLIVSQFLLIIIACKKKSNVTEAIPLAPTSLVAVSTTANQIKLNWTDNSTNEIGFKIQRKTAVTPYTEIASVNKDITTYTDNGLNSNTTYTYRVYAYNSSGNSITYTNEASTTTVGLPQITTSVLSSLTPTSLISGGNIISDGGSPISAKGVVWSTSSNPSVNLATKTNDGTGTAPFISTINGLSPNTSYFIRSYATNIAGTSYGNEISFTTPTSLTDVYVAGAEANINSGVSVAKVWKNGTAVNLSAVSGFNSEAYSVAASSFDIYAAGYQSGGGNNNIATYWKNGVATLVTNGSNDAAATSVAVSGTDVYLAFYESNGSKYIAKVWKNGVVTALTNGLNDAFPNEIVIAGTDVYVAGTESNGTNTVAKFWKNGAGFSLPTGSGFNSSANAIFIVGSDIFIAGSDSSGFGFKNRAKIWKNGVAVSLTNGSNDAEAYGVYVSNNNVYAVGYEMAGNYKVAKIWKNGVAVSLTNGLNDAEAYGVCVSGNDVYAVGYEMAGNYKVAKIWKNGVSTTISAPSTAGIAYRLIVK